ncbi:hypothetical protein L226DRAFT_127239 [Lentinus tigrinus ALCF2SS1-7]|uniref:uncharacterized protein n=1 Tax=Lentinus tigrinus ALCF2SS1-7 TaxID=1328758 RepID=UPI00116607A9|nr:hypothetical protein L226DRAFT_127239 [Lentinus tigrinus ALCF2SS1-7]
MDVWVSLTDVCCNATECVTASSWCGEREISRFRMLFAPLSKITPIYILCGGLLHVTGSYKAAYMITYRHG